MNYKYLIFVILIMGLIPSADASTCNVRNSDCTIFGEQCLFSMFSQTNAHVSECSTPFYTWNVCCEPEPTNFTATGCYVNTTGNCNVGEGEIISMYNRTNSHAEVYGLGNYNNTVCCEAPVTWDSYDCHLVNTTATPSGCTTDETAVISMYRDTNSHVGNSSAYENLLCCQKEDITPPIAIVTFSEIVPSSSITFDVNCTDLGGSGGCDKVNISTSFDYCEATGFVSGLSSCTIALTTCDNNAYDIDVNATDIYGNYNYTANYGSFQVKKDDGCICTTNDECAASCVEGICSSSGDEPFISFNRATTSTNVIIGNTENIYIELQNPTYATKKIPLYLGSFDNIKNWVWFDGHKYDVGRRNITVQLGPKEERIITVKVLGGMTGQYNLAIGSDDDYTNKYDEITINVISDADSSSMFSPTPGLGIVSLLIIMLFGSILR